MIPVALPPRVTGAGLTSPVRTLDSTVHCVSYLTSIKTRGSHTTLITFFILRMAFDVPCTYMYFRRPRYLNICNLIILIVFSEIQVSSDF